MAQRPEYVERVLEEVRARGPLSGEELHHPEGTERKMTGAWVTVPRAVLEAHFGRGVLAVLSHAGAGGASASGGVG